jgi:MFS family permease
LLLFSQFILFIGVGAVIPSLPLYGKELGLAGAANGIVISAPAVALLLCANKAGQLADRQGRKTAMIYGMVLIAISDIGTAISNDLFTLAIARLGLGAGRAVSESGERGMLADFANRLPDGVRGKALAAQQAIVALGIAIGAPVGGVVVEQYGPRASFLCVSAAAVITCALYGFLPETLPTALSTHGLRKDDGIDNMKKMPMLTNEICDRNEHGSFRLWRDLLRDDEWKGLSLVQAGVSFGYAAKIAAIPILATDVYENGAFGTGTLLSAAALSGLVGAPLGGLVTDRVGAKQTAVFSGIIAGLALVVVPISLLTRSQSFPSHLDVPTVAVGNLVLDGRSFSFSALVLVWSMATAAQGPALTAFAQTKAARGLEATSLALVKAAGDLTYIFAPLLMGLLADTIEVPGVQCVLAGFAILLGTSALAILREDEGRTNEVKENSE